MSETPRRVDIWLDVADRDDLWTGWFHIRPDDVRVTAVRDKEPTVTVRGPVVEDGQVSDWRAGVTYGREGTAPLADAPDWVTDLAGQAAWGEVPSWG